METLFQLRWSDLPQKNSGYAVPKIFNFCFFQTKTGPAIKIHFKEAV